MGATFVLLLRERGEAVAEERSFCSILCDEVRVMQYSIKEVTSAEAERNGLMPLQSYVLNTLLVRDGEPAKALAGCMSMAPSNLTPLLHDLTEMGYVRREQDEDDRRSYRVWLTDEGRKKARLVNAGIDEAFGGNDEEARGLHARILDGIAAYHELMGLEPLEWNEACGQDCRSEANARSNQGQNHEEG